MNTNRTYTAAQLTASGTTPQDIAEMGMRPESEREALRVAEGLVTSFRRQFRLRKVRLVGVELLVGSIGPYVTKSLPTPT